MEPLCTFTPVRLSVCHSRLSVTILVIDIKFGIVVQNSGQTLLIIIKKKFLFKSREIKK